MVIIFPFFLLTDGDLVILCIHLPFAALFSFFMLMLLILFHVRGNQAYAKGDFSKAEECYTYGLNCISQTEASRSCLRALMLCYSNRAATRMSLGRVREALEDCTKAAALDPSFLRVQVRAARFEVFKLRCVPSSSLLHGVVPTLLAHFL